MMPLNPNPNPNPNPNSKARYRITSRIPLYRVAFDMFDIDKGGTLSFDEFKIVLKATGNKTDNAKAEAYLQSIDDDGDGCLDFPEMVRFFAELGDGKSAKLLNAHVEALGNLWKLLDPEERGYFTSADWRRLLRLFLTLTLTPTLTLTLIGRLFELDQDVTDPELELAMQMAGADIFESTGSLRGDRLVAIRIIVVDPIPVLIKFVEKIRVTREIYSLFDYDESGTISVQELGEVLTTLLHVRPNQLT